MAKVSREKKRVILKRKLNLLHVEYEENADGSVYNCRHDACLRRVDPQPPTAADAIDADGPADERPYDPQPRPKLEAAILPRTYLRGGRARFSPTYG